MKRRMVNRIQFARKLPILGACSMFTAMCQSGASTDMLHILKGCRSIRVARNLGTREYYVVAMWRLRLTGVGQRAVIMASLVALRL
jgi:hypothetical protein